MRVFKSLLPVIILLIVSVYSYQKYDLLPVSIVNGIAFLPHMLAMIVIGLSIYFNRSQVFFYVVLLVAANVVLRSDWTTSDLSYALLSIFSSFLMLTLTLLPDRGIMSIRAIPAYAVLLASIGFSIYATIISPVWVEQILLSDWLPPQYFNWTRLSQSVLMTFVASLFSMLVLCILRPSPRMAAGFGVLFLLIIQMHFGYQSRSLIVFSSAALLMCLYAIMQESWRMAYLDELTGLPARRALREKFQRIGGLYTVAMLDVDHFKKFNDTYGHDAGDAVLRMIAAKISKVSGGGLPYRYGGEEFTIIIPGRNRDDAWHFLDALRESIEKSPFVITRADRRNNRQKAKQKKNKSVNVTASIGIADSKGEVSSPWDVLKQADKALYRAKGKGRNCVSE